MTYLFNQPSAFAAELIEGFVAANADKVRQVLGGVIRNTRSQPGSVAAVVGGGSGHDPAFAGLVGQGLAHGAAMGNLIASPSAQQIYNVARAADNGGGVLLMFGNYAGDVLHFGQACERLRGDGIPCEILAVTDDISSASVDEIEKQRGVAGDLTVFKVASAAAEAGGGAAGRAAPVRLVWHFQAVPYPVPRIRCSRSKKDEWRWGWAFMANPGSKRRTCQPPMKWLKSL